MFIQRFYNIFIIPNFARTHNSRTKLCRQNIGITPPKEPNLFKVWLGGPSGGFCFAKSGIIIFSPFIVLGCATNHQLDNPSVQISPQLMYLGTLSFNGTKERIKLGGVPVIKPGFDYQMEVRDEHKEAFADFSQKYPAVKNPKNVSLIQIGKNR